MKKIFTLLLSALLVVNFSKAQFFNYLAPNASLNATTGVYNDLGTSGTKITTNYTGGAMGTLNDNSAILPIGFTFNFAGTDFTTFVLNTNGFIRLGTKGTDIAESANVLFSTDTTATNVIYPYNINLQPTANTEYRYITTGTAPNRVLTVQFKAVQDSGCPTCSPATAIQYDAIEFQALLYETSNKIEFILGNFSANLNASGFIPSNCGIKSSDPSHSLNVTKSSQTAYASAGFIEGAYTGNAFNNRNSLLPPPGFTITFNPIPVLNSNVTMLTTYTNGKVPQNYDHADSVYIQNRGKTTYTNFPVNLDITGANTFNFQQIIPSLAPNEKKVVVFPNTPSANVGKNTLIFSVPNDDDNTDNRDTAFEQVSATTIGMCFDTIMDGNLGQTNNSIDLAIRFRLPGVSTTTPNKITSITNYFATAGKGYSVRIFGVSADTPKTTLYSSGTKTSVAGKNVITLATPLNVTGDFFMVITQPSVTTSFGCGFQRENPIRSKTFFFRSPSATTSTWFDFAPNNSFKLMADVTMQSTFVPIKLTSFNAYKQGKENLLTWQTASEVNSLGYEIQRSKNGSEFTKIGFVNSIGNSNSITNYSFNDKEPINGTNYYRLRQLDKDGKEFISEIVLVNNETKKNIEIVKLYPNPAKNIATVVFTGNVNTKVNVNITNLFGKVVQSKVVTLNSGENKLDLSLELLAAGTYIVTVGDMNSENFATTKFTKQ